MYLFPRGVACAVVALVAVAGETSAQTLEVAGHLGTLDDGRRLLGGQAGVSVARDWAVSFGATSVRGGGPGTSLVNFEVVTRWTAAKAGAFRWYGLAGAAVERVHVSDVTYDDVGWVAGVGAGVRVGKAEPFLEVRAFKDGAVASFFWVGLRLRTQR